jgi:hypothetical protein
VHGSGDTLPDVHIDTVIGSVGVDLHTRLMQTLARIHLEVIMVVLEITSSGKLWRPERERTKLGLPKKLVPTKFALTKPYDKVAC